MTPAAAVHKPFTGAFVVPTSQHKGVNYLYFGIEHIKTTNTLEASGFGGKRDFKHHESLQECATREFAEESLGVFAKEKSIKKRLADQRKYGVHKVDVHNTSTVYFVPLKIKGNPMTKFAVERKNPKLKKHQKEMQKVIAVKFSDVVNQYKTTPHNLTFEGHKARAVLAIALKEGVRQGFIK